MHEEDSEGVIVDPRKVQQCLTFIHILFSMFLIEIVTMAPFKRPVSKATNKSCMENISAQYDKYQECVTYIDIYVTQKILQLPWHKIN
jgi:hypothetical protein